MLPMLRMRGAPTAIEHPSITLASVFLETKTERLSDHWMHVQIVPMNNMIVQSAGLPGTNHPVIGPAWKPLLRRMMAAWCGMHSDHSSAVELCLRKDGTGTDLLELDLVVSERALAAGRVAAKDIFWKGLLFGTVFLHRMIKFSNPGSGTHCGASFPMKERPVGLFDTDRLGRPFGWSKIFVVEFDGPTLNSGHYARIFGHLKRISDRQPCSALTSRRPRRQTRDDPMQIPHKILCLH